MTITPIFAHGGPLTLITLGAFAGGGACIIAGVVLRRSASATTRDRRAGAILCGSGIAMILGLFIFWRQLFAFFG
jgi:hypothetical protein